MVDLMLFLANSYLLILYYHIIILANLTSSIICCLFSGETYIFVITSNFSDWESVSDQSLIICCKLFVNLLVILLLIKWPVASALFWIALFEAVLSTYVADCLAWPRRFWPAPRRFWQGLYLPFELFIFLLIFCSYF